VASTAEDALRLERGSRRRDSYLLARRVPQRRGGLFGLEREKGLPQTTTHDRFHVSKPLNQAVDKTRREESGEVGRQRRRHPQANPLPVAAWGNTPRTCSRPTCAPLGPGPTKSKWWSSNEPDADAGKAFFEEWYLSVMRSKLPAVKRVAKTLKAHLGGLLTYFKHRITNALTEGFNSKIQAIKADARGFRRFENYRTRILFFCGKLDMMPDSFSPATHSKA